MFSKHILGKSPSQVNIIITPNYHPTTHHHLQEGNSQPVQQSLQAELKSAGLRI